MITKGAMPHESRKWIWPLVFGVSMGYFEAAVVVYLRMLLCPGGNLFPINLNPGTVGLVELGREFFSLVMILAVAGIAGRKPAGRTAWFFILFGIWDIFYYVFLKLLIGWPESLMTWDLLFLLPVPWTAPVLAPIMVSLLLIGMGWRTLQKEATCTMFRHAGWFVLLETIAALIMIVSFCLHWKEIAAGGLPHAFPWGLFAFSIAMMTVVYAWFDRVWMCNDRSTNNDI